MKKYYQLALFTLFGMYSNAQAPTLDWAGQIESSEYAYGEAITTDANGNVYTVGYFEGTGDFDPSAGTSNQTATNETAFIQKLNADGDLVWTKFISGTSSVRAADIALDTSGNIHVTGSFKGTVDFDPGAGTATAVSTSATTYDPFVLRLDANGDFLWSRVPLTGTENIEAFSIVVDTNGYSYITGYYRGEMIYNIFLNPYWTISNGNSDVFFMKLDQTGYSTAAGVFGGTGWDYGTSINVDSNGNMYVVGHAAGTVDFDPLTGVYELTSTGQSAVYILKLDTWGGFQWAKNLTGPSAQDYTQYSRSVIDENANLYITGKHKGTIDFDPNAGAFELTSPGAGAIFIEKMDSSGNMVWANSFGAGTEFVNSIDVDNNGATYMTGQFGGTVDFDPSASSSNLTSMGSEDIYIQKLDTDGNFEWAQSMGGIDYDYGTGITLDQDNDILLTGSFLATADLDPGAGTMNFTSVGSEEDVFVLKLDNCLPTVTSLTVDNCYSYTVPSGNAVYTASGTYNDTLVNQCGADSILIIDLTINTVDVSVTNTDPTLTAGANGATYQWLECPAMTEISGATDQSYTPTTNGDYAVIVTENGCSDTSICYTVASVNIDELNWGDQISISPNPTDQNTTIDLGNIYEEVETQIVNQLGQVIQNQKFESTEKVVVELDEGQGVYFFIIQTQNFRAVRKVIKK